MSHEKRTYDLFNPSGCLTQEALLRYVKDELSKADTEIINKHLIDCEICKDAIEGISNVQDLDRVTENIESIKNKLKVKYAESTTTRQVKTYYLGNRLAWIGAAASVVIIIGLLYFFTGTIDLNSRQSAQDIKTEDIAVPPMPKAKNQVSHSEEDGSTEKSIQTIKEPTDKGKGYSESNEISVTKNASEKKDSPKRSEKITPLKIHKPQNTTTDTQMLEQLAEPKSEYSEEIKSIEADIASAQPVEYYLGEIVVYNQDIEGIYLDEAVVEEKANAPASFKQMRSKGAASNKSEDFIENNPIGSKAENKDSSAKRSENEHFFTVVDQMPQFPGGQGELQKYLSENIQYPAKAAQMNIQGTVVISFIVEKDGSITHTKLESGIGGGCDEEAIRVIQSMPAWQPAIKEGIPMRAIFNLPIKFRLR